MNSRLLAEHDEITLDARPLAGVAVPALKSLFHKLLLLACALHLSGAHWAVLQVTAWTGMLVVRSQTEGVAEAVKTTFDGEHPCVMCSAIESGQKEEKRNDMDAPMMKALMEVKLVAMENAALPVPADAGELRWMNFSPMASLRTDAPPTPPPLA
jgi:hypothetical protein